MFIKYLRGQMLNEYGFDFIKDNVGSKQQPDQINEKQFQENEKEYC